ncbi:hypothetical protein HDU76_010818 [Blyttiomyces sp. JEL0837]|nr:hypothetical protein HDU76_010818 [Blyttiomyces sp. JEL0837]
MADEEKQEMVLGAKYVLVKMHLEKHWEVCWKKGGTRDGDGGIDIHQGVKYILPVQAMLNMPNDLPLESVMSITLLFLKFVLAVDWHGTVLLPVRNRRGIREDTSYFVESRINVNAEIAEEWIAMAKEGLKMKGCIFEVIGTLDSDCAELVDDTLWQVKGLRDVDEPFSIMATDMTLIIAVGERGKL